MTERVVIGPRANGDVGVFVSPTGVSAWSAADSALILSITSKISRLVKIGYVSAGGPAVALGFSRLPYVILDAYQPLSTYNFTGLVAPNPYNPVAGVTTYGRATATFNSGGASMTVSAGYTVRYQIFNGAWT